MLFIGLLSLSALWWWPVARDLAAVGTGYGAKALCSAVFISERDSAEVLETDLSDLPGIVTTHVNEGARTVTASVGPVTRTARYREGLGCTLALADIEEMSVERPAVNSDKTRDLMKVPADDPLRLALGPVLETAFSEPVHDWERGTRAIVVLHRGRIVAERYAPGFDADTPLPGWSMAKSVTNALAGIVLKRGKLALDDTVPGWTEAGDGREQVTVQHLLQMTSGLEFGEEHVFPLGDSLRMLFAEPDAAAFVRDLPMGAAPGTRWEYTSGTTNLLMWVLREALEPEADWLAFPREVLFEPLGMHSAVLEPDAYGTFLGSSFMFATARDWARFGQLYLQDGQWDGEQILPEGWVALTRQPAPHAPKGRYGAHFWLNRGDPETGERPWPKLPDDAYAALGYQGQEIVIVPSEELVAVRLGLSRPSEAWDRERFVGGVIELLR